MALMEDPGYGMAHFRKCTILEARCEYSQALNLAQGSIDEYSHDMEDDPANVKMIPKFQDFVERVQGKVHIEQKMKQMRLEAEVEKELEGADEVSDMWNQIMKISGGDGEDEESEGEDKENQLSGNKQAVQ